MASQDKQYRRQVEVVHGFQYDGTNANDVIDFCHGSEGTAEIEGGKLMLTHPGGTKQEIRVSDWILADAWEKNFVMADPDFHIVYAPGPATVDHSRDV
jgi:hypothetical protein